MFQVGDRIVVDAGFSTFHQRKGTVVAVHDGSPMVKLDDGPIGAICIATEYVLKVVSAEEIQSMRVGLLKLVGRGDGVQIQSR